MFSRIFRPRTSTVPTQLWHAALGRSESRQPAACLARSASRRRADAGARRAESSRHVLRARQACHSEVRRASEAPSGGRWSGLAPGLAVRSRPATDQTRPGKAGASLRSRPSVAIQRVRDCTESSPVTRARSEGPGRTGPLSRDLLEWNVRSAQAVIRPVRSTPALRGEPIGGRRIRTEPPWHRFVKRSPRIRRTGRPASSCATLAGFGPARIFPL